MKQSICAGAILIKKNKFLLGKRAKTKSWAPGLWDIVGGQSLKNEHPLYTLQREVQEETGITVLSADLVLTLNIKGIAAKSGFLYHIYVVTHSKGKPANKSKEHSKLKWFTRDELSHIKIALPEYLSLFDALLANN